MQTFWQLGDRTLVFENTPLPMGIVNVTPDSFSDGGRYFETEAAIRHAFELVADGAAILDIGGESTRPGSESVSPEEQIRRTIPVIERLAGEVDVPISIDTTSARVAREAIAVGATIINETSGAGDDSDMIPLLLQSDVGVCIMHRRGVPSSMQERPHYDDVFAEVFHYLDERVNMLTALGIAKRRIAIDPGLGFGKTTEHNRTLIESIDRFQEIGCVVLVGHSRKRFLDDLYPEMDRDAATALVSEQLARAGVQVLRVHRVR